MEVIKYECDQHNAWWISLEVDGVYINTPIPEKILHLDYIVRREVTVYTNDNTYAFPIIDDNHGNAFNSFFLLMEKRRDYMGDTALYEDKTEMSLRLLGDQYVKPRPENFSDV